MMQHSRYNVQYYSYPYPHIIIDDVFDDYEDLVNTYPSIELMKEFGVIKGPQSDPSWIDYSPLSGGEISDRWKEVMNEFTDRSFFEFLCSQFGLECENYTYSHRSIPADIQYECQFRENSERFDRTGMKLHLDKPNKIFQSFLYFRHQDDISTGGNLCMYKGSELAKELEYRPNRFISFMNTPESWHSVNPRSDAKYPRKIINIVFQK